MQVLIIIIGCLRALLIGTRRVNGDQILSLTQWDAALLQERWT